MSGTESVNRVGPTAAEGAVPGAAESFWPRTWWSIVDFKIDRPGRYVLVDHALSRLERGLAGYLVVDGPSDDDLMHSGPVKR